MHCEYVHNPTAGAWPPQAAWLAKSAQSVLPLHTPRTRGIVRGGARACTRSLFLQPRVPCAAQRMRTVRASDAQLAPAEVVHVARPLAPLLGKLIRDTRAWHDMSMHELARRVGCSEGYIGLIELHGRIPRPAMLKKFADVLDLDWQYLAELARHAPEEQSLTD